MNLPMDQDITRTSVLITLSIITTTLLCVEFNCTRIEYLMIGIVLFYCLYLLLLAVTRAVDRYIRHKWSTRKRVVMVDGLDGYPKAIQYHEAIKNNLEFVELR